MLSPDAGPLTHIISTPHAARLLQVTQSRHHGPAARGDPAIKRGSRCLTGCHEQPPHATSCRFFGACPGFPRSSLCYACPRPAGHHNTTSQHPADAPRLATTGCDVGFPHFVTLEYEPTQPSKGIPGVPPTSSPVLSFISCSVRTSALLRSYVLRLGRLCIVLFLEV